MACSGSPGFGPLVVNGGGSNFVVLVEFPRALTEVIVARPRDIGTKAESAVVKVMQRSGFPTAERRALRGSQDAGDITGVPGLVIEVKGGETAKSASDGLIAAWLAETETERRNAKADIGILVVQRRGVGLPNAHLWWAIIEGRRLSPDILSYGPVRLFLDDALWWLRAQGYGIPLGRTA